MTTSFGGSDRDAWADAALADAYAYGLQNATRREVLGTKRPQTLFGRRSSAAADVFEVAGDAWEVAGDHAAAEIRRGVAQMHRTEAFKATHRYLSLGWFTISDIEAGKLVRASGGALPRWGYVRKVQLGFAGPQVDLARMKLTEQEQDVLGRLGCKRKWVWAVGGLYR